MISLPRLKTIAAAAGACVAIFTATPASAFVYAVSHLQIQDLKLTFDDPNSVINNFSFDLSNTATMNGVSSPNQTANCFSSNGVTNNCGIAPVLNAAQAIAPPSNLIRPADYYGFATPVEKDVPGLKSFSRSDSIIRTAQLVTGTPTSTEQIAESLLNISGAAKANAEIQSHTSLRTTGTFSGVVDLKFMADPDQLAEIGGGSTGVSAQSNMNASFTISLGGNKITFTPTGAGNDSDCLVSGSFAFKTAVKCTVSGDTESLNSNPSVGMAGTDENSFADADADVFTAFGVHITGLAAATYNIAFDTFTSTSIVAAVPEPGTTGLVGAALAGLAFTTVRRKRKQS